MTDEEEKMDEMGFVRSGTAYVMRERSIIIRRAPTQALLKPWVAMRLGEYLSYINGNVKRFADPVGAGKAALRKWCGDRVVSE